MHLAAARALSQALRDLLEAQEQVSLIFALVPFQDEFLAVLAVQPDLDWQWMVAFHMDEYIGLLSNEPHNFGHFLCERLFDQVKPGRVHCLHGNASTRTKGESIAIVYGVHLRLP